MALAWLLRGQRRWGLGRGFWNVNDAREPLRLGLPLGLERFLDGSSFSVMVLIFARMGDADLAAPQIVMQLCLVGFLPMLAIGESTGILVGRAVGTGELRLVTRLTSVGFSLAQVVAVTIAMILWGFRHSLMGLFTSDPAVQSAGRGLLPAVALVLVMDPGYKIFRATLYGVGDVRAVASGTVALAWLCTPPLTAFFLVYLGYGALGGWIGLVAEITLGSMWFGYRFARGRWCSGPWPSVNV